MNSWCGNGLITVDCVTSVPEQSHTWQGVPTEHGSQSLDLRQYERLSLSGEFASVGTGRDEGTTATLTTCKSDTGSREPVAKPLAMPRL